MRADSVQKGGSLLSYGLLVMTVTHTLTHVFQNIHTALFPILRGPQEFNLTLQQLGFIAAIPYLCQVILAVPLGILSDKFGSKKMVLVSMAVAAVGSLIASQAMNPVMLTIAVSLVYINTAIYHPASYSFTTRLFRPRDRSKALGIHGGGGTLGMAIGPISVSVLMTFFAFGWRLVYLFWFIPILLGVFLVLRVRSEPKEDSKDDVSAAETYQPEKSSMFTMSFVLFLVFLGVRMLGGGMISPFLTVFLVDEKGLDTSIASLVLGGSTIVGLVAAPIGGVLASRFGEKRWLIVSLALAYLSLGLGVAVPNVYFFVTLYIAHGFCNTLGMAANSAIMASLSPSRQRGLGYALFFLPGEIMGVIAPILAALVAAAFGLTSIFLISLIIYMTGLAVLRFGVKV